jgi:hypothetical protein
MSGMGDPRWHALWEDRPWDDVLEGTNRERVRGAGTVWLVHRCVREAILGVLLLSLRPMTIDQILADLEARDVRIGHVDNPRKAVSDAMRYQARIGRVSRVGRGVYVVLPSRLPRTTEWRMRRRLEDRSWPGAHWEVADTRPTLDVPLVPHMRSDAFRTAPAVSGAEPLPSIDEIAANWPILSDLWPSAS